MMESELLAYKAPLYGRYTAQLNIEPMDYISSQKFYPKHDFENFVSFYSVTGGMPAYMEQFSRYNSVVEAVENLCWNKQGLYHNEVNAMLKQELRTPNNYFAILKAIALGKTKISEIASDSDLEAQLVNKYIDTLVRLQLVKREVPVTEDKPHKSKKGIYILTENFVRFWFQYVFAYSSDLEIGNYSQVKRRFKEYSNILEAMAYEDISRVQLRLNQDRLFEMDKVGRYWNKDVEIDGVGFNQKTKQIAVNPTKLDTNYLALRDSL